MQRLLRTGLFMLTTAAAVGYFLGAIGAPSPFGKGKNGRKSPPFLANFDLNTLSQKIFGQSSAEMQRQLQTVLRNFRDKLGEVQRGASDLSEVDYEKLVTDFTKKLETDKSFTKTQIKKIADYLRSDFGVLPPTAEEV